MRRLVPLLFGLFFCRALAQNALTADDLVSRNIKARGGMARLAGIKTLRTTYATEEDGKPVQLIEVRKRPNLLRRDITFQGNTIIFAYDGKTAWQSSSQAKGPSPVPAELALELKEEADFDGSMVNYKEKGSTVELVGKEKSGAKGVYNLKATSKEGHVVHVYLDAGNFLEVKETGSYKKAGKPVDYVTLSKDYRPVQGILFPFLVEQKENDEENQVVHVKKIEPNVRIVDSFFTMPATTSR